MPSDADDDSGDEKSSSSSSKRVLNDAVYGGWKSRTLQAVDRKEVGVYVDGSRRCPTAWSGAAVDLAAAAAAQEAILKWITKDRLAKSIIASRLPFRVGRLN